MIKKLLSFILNLILPARCYLCDVLVQHKNGLCPECYDKIKWAGLNVCQVCGMPIYMVCYDGCRCIDCIKHRPSFHRLRFVFAYDNFSRDLILPFKHADKVDMAPFLANLIMHSYPEMIDISDVIIPVPLHYTRLFSRKYNQSALLAKQIARTSKKLFIARALVRIKKTKSQGHLSPSARYKNIKNAFEVKQLSLIKDKTVLLIDDVMTTGATINECARILKKSGAKCVYCLVLSRVIKD